MKLLTRTSLNFISISAIFFLLGSVMMYFSVKNIIRQGVSPKPTYLLCLASYQSLRTYDWSKSLTNQKDFEEVFKLQVTEPEVELRIKNKKQERKYKKKID